MRHRPRPATATVMTAFPDEPAYVVELGAFQDRQGQNAAAIATFQQALMRDNGSGAREPRSVPPLQPPERSGPRAAACAGRVGHVHDARGAWRRRADAVLSDRRVACGRRGRAGGGDEACRRGPRDLPGAELSVQRLPRVQLSCPRRWFARQPGRRRSLWREGVGGCARGGQRRPAAARADEPRRQLRLPRQPGRAAGYYEQSAKLYEALGDEPRAAQIEANAGAMRVEFGLDSDAGLRAVQNALAVFRKLGDRNFEVFAAQVTAAYHRYGGRHADAERELNRALAIAKERNLDDSIAVPDHGPGAIAARPRRLRERAEAADQRARGRHGPEEHGYQDPARHGRDAPGKCRSPRRSTFAGLRPTSKRAASVPSCHCSIRRWARSRTNRARSPRRRSHFSRSAALWVDEGPDAAERRGSRVSRIARRPGRKVFRWRGNAPRMH